MRGTYPTSPECNGVIDVNGVVKPVNVAFCAGTKEARFCRRWP